MEANDYIIGRKVIEETAKKDPPDEPPVQAETQRQRTKGALILDATCTPLIRFEGYI